MRCEACALLGLRRSPLLYFTTMILLFAECFGASENFPPLLSQNDPGYLSLEFSRVC